MTLCPNCHEQLFGFCNFCDCGYLYDPIELMRRDRPEKVELVYRSRDMRTTEEPFAMTHDPEPPAEDEEGKKTEMPGWYWQKMKKAKQAREEAQHALELGIQLNFFEHTVDGAKNVPQRKRAPRVSQDYGERMEGFEGEKRRGQGKGAASTDRPPGVYGLSGADS